MLCVSVTLLVKWTRNCGYGPLLVNNGSYWSLGAIYCHTAPYCWVVAPYW